MGLIETLESIFSTIAGANGFFILLAFLAVLGDVFFQCLRWKFSLDAIAESPRLGSLFLITVGGISINNITPVRGFGGEPYRIYALKKRSGVRASDGLASILAERILEVLSLAILLVICLLLAIYRYTLPSPINSLVWICVVALASFIVVFRIILHKKISFLGGVANRLIRLFRSREKQAKTFFGGLRLSANKIFSDLKSCIKVCCCEFARRLCDVARFAAIFLALGAWLSPELILIAIIISSVAGVLPLPGGLGAYDLALGGILIPLGVSPAVAFAVVLINRGISYIPLTVAGFSAISYMRIPLRRK